MRYLPLTSDDRQAMLGKIGVRHVDDLFKDIPSEFLNPEIDLPRHKTELEVERHLSRMASKNTAAGSVPFFVGAGAYKHHVPSTVDHIIQRGEFLTAYTPYQPEIAQGTLQYIFEFQTQIAQLTGMDVANASMYDGSTATAEAVMMARRVTRKKRAVIAGCVHPHYRAVVETTTQYTDDEVVALDAQPADAQAELQAAIDAIDETTSCVVFQNPGVCGNVLDLTPLAEKAHANKALLIVVVTEVMSLGLITSPGEMGADIVVGEAQSIGNGLNFGGPYLGMFATNQKYVRQMPGRLCGETVDSDGTRGFVLTLSTREQHIRREKATSNICTNSGLCSLAFTIHMSLLGEKGLRKLSKLNHKKAVDVKNAIAAIDGVEVLNSSFFNEFAVRLPKNAADVVEKLASDGVLAGVPFSRLDPNAGHDDVLLIAATETVTDGDIEELVSALKGAVA
ncbi:aminomethyl-transferring glycine dehydrogenase subunit GcvPA [Kordiimonas sp. SCSIO 12603]|uniref:aminomethyl-transferring glycine dehydrogenase subunit GcvPA n=1 Tax=Kordiimonas sp. SCSIO 12603 TaxID=2829596 RepID=UPI002106E8B5|nr:aminomethyl-transferring glycine dehydrogenase subunit GcvPA [Kordiimonas sp. SCSIO 12603]UTW58166.1 aminomethyl-transferring glycine dehydrogenase subunit GcvPA [Kordiimonas sp. SCSIO 12603]